MNELELYKFIEDKETSFDGETAILWIHHVELESFVKLIGAGLLDEGGFDVKLQEDYIAVEMNDICEYHDIELDKVFNKTN